MRTPLAFALGIVAASTVALAEPAESQLTLTAPPTKGYAYTAATGRAEVNIDQFMPECMGATAVVTISPDRKEAELKCRRDLIDNWHSVQLPVFQANPTFSVTWSR